MQERERISFSEWTVHTIPFRGPFYKARPVVKWGLILCWLLYFGVVVLLLKGDTFLNGLRAVGIPSFVAVSWLFTTRSRTLRTVMDAEFIFFAGAMTAAYEKYPSAGRYDAQQFRQVYSTIQYSDITEIKYNMSYHRLEIYGTVTTRITERDEDGRLAEKPVFHKTRRGAVINSYLPEERAEEIVSAVCRNTGYRPASVKRY